MFRDKLKTPYYAVIFSSTRTRKNNGFDEMDKLIYSEVEKQPGYIGHEGARQEDGFGIHVSYWESIEAIRSWKENKLHIKAKELGKEEWYAEFKTKICKVEKEY